MREVALRDGDDDPCDLSRRSDEVIDQSVDRVDAGSPRACRGSEGSALCHAAFPSDDPADPNELLRHPGIHLDDVVVHRFDLAQNTALARGKTDREIPVPRCL